MIWTGLDIRRMVKRLAFAFAFSVFALATINAQQTSTHYYWCGGRVLEQTYTTYYSGAFETSEQSLWTVTNAWKDYLKAKYDVTAVDYCRSYSFWTDVYAAEIDRNKDAKDGQYFFKRSPVFTGWTY